MVCGAFGGNSASWLYTGGANTFSCIIIAQKGPYATCPVLREDQWERFQESYALSLALPPHIPPQGGGGLYLGSDGRSEVCVSF